MSDHDNESQAKRNIAPLIGFALGAVVGGALALLLAPASGEKTRRQLGNAARRMGRDARHTFDEARESLGEAAADLGEDVKAAVDAGREAFQKDGPGDGSLASRTAQLLNLPGNRKS